MKNLLFFSLLIVLYSCSGNKDVIHVEDQFYYRISSKDRTSYSDTFTLDKIHKHAEKDTMLCQKMFEYKGTGHTVNMYTNSLYAGVDGAYIAYELDNLGIIYNKSTTWISYGKLESNNDSINELITIALETIILHKDFNCSDLQKLYDYANKDVVAFLPPRK